MCVRAGIFKLVTHHTRATTLDMFEMALLLKINKKLWEKLVKLAYF